MTNVETSSRTHALSRRAFVGASALTAASLALQGCSSNEAQMQEGLADTAPIEEGEWKSALCWAHCGGQCSLNAYVVDGICTQVKTDTTGGDSPDNPQKRACLRGRSRRMDIYSPNRLKYPMKRASWQPGGGENAHGELRGIDDWERITWDEALDLVADEMSRIKGAYGNRAIFGTDQGHVIKRFTEFMPAENGVMVGMSFMNALNQFGGYVHAWSTMSQGAYKFSKMLYGYGDRGWNNDRFDGRNCDYAIMLGVNLAVSGDSTRMFSVLKPMRDAGTKFYFVDPMYQDTAAALNGEWVPIRPGTDKAMLLAMAYVMFTEDDDGSLIDWDFLNRCAVGHDADHMPDGENPEGNFKDYVLGTYTNDPKTPQWAESICGVPAAKIEELARIMGKDNKVAFIAGIGPARCNNAEAFTQLHMIVGAMGGHIGKSGHMTGTNSNLVACNEQIDMLKSGASPLASVNADLDDCMHEPLMWNALLDGQYNCTGFMESKPGEIRDISIKCFYSYTMNTTQHAINMPKAIEFYKTLDLFVCHAYTFNDNARYADIVLPITTRWEKPPMIKVTTEFCTFGDTISNPIYEAKSDQWIGAELLKRWGLDPSISYNTSEAEQSFAVISGTEVIKDDGSYEPLVSFTDEEAAIFGPTATPRTEGRISYTELAEAGVYSVPRSANDNYTFIGGQSFREDPENNPLESESGKLEFYSKTARDKSRQLGAGYSELPCLPEYIPTVNGYEATFKDFSTGEKATYPYQLYTPHYYRSAHAHYDNIPWLREAFIRPVFLNTTDATEKGISDGDTVRVFNDNGSVLRPACVTDRIVPGVVGLPHGAAIEVDQKTGFNIAGSDNWLTYPVTTGFGTDGYNTQVCNFEKWTGDFTADAERPEPVPSCQQA